MRVRAFLVKGDFGLALSVQNVGVSDKHPEISFKNVGARLVLNMKILVGVVTDYIRTVQHDFSTQLGQTAYFHTDRVSCTNVEFVYFLLFGLQEDWNAHRSSEFFKSNGAVQELLW